MLLSGDGIVFSFPSYEKSFFDAFFIHGTKCTFYSVVGLRDKIIT